MIDILICEEEKINGVICIIITYLKISHFLIKSGFRSSSGFNVVHNFDSIIWMSAISSEAHLVSLWACKHEVKQTKHCYYPKKSADYKSNQETVSWAFVIYMQVSSGGGRLATVLAHHFSTIVRDRGAL